MLSRLCAITLILALVVPPLPAAAEIWRCGQAGGAELFTDQADNSGGCQKYENTVQYEPNVMPAPAPSPAPALPPGTQPPPPETATPPKRIFTQQELDQMLAPIALYPDALLSQILMASTYPLEVVEAARWSRANPNAKGDQAVQAVTQFSWDPSVKSLVAFPQVLQTMDQNLEWMEKLGDAFLAQEVQVMDTVQNLRQKAAAAGNLKSNEQVRVDQQGQTIIVQQANPQVVYVPYYDPWYVYGPWWWPGYPPFYWAPWPGYYVQPGFYFGWGIGISVGVGFFFGGFDWYHHHAAVVNVNNFYVNRTVIREGAWRHDPVHRRGVVYRDAGVRQQFGRGGASPPETRREFRGHEPSSFGGGGVNRFGTRPEARAPESRPQERSAPSGRSDMRGAPSRPSAPAAPPTHAFEGVGHGPDVRNFSSRGHSSFQGSGGGSHGGGGSRGGGGGGGGHARR